VWIGEHCATGMRVALKTLLPETSTNPEIVQRFKREGLLLGRVRSDRVARVIDFLFDAKCGPVLVTEFVEGHSLADEPEGAPPSSVEDAVELGIEIATALRDLHRAQIVHRDLKPGNVILQPLEDGRSRAVIVDLGVSRLIAPVGEDDTQGEALTDITKTHIVLGTLGFMAPEQILGPRGVTATADIYSLGAILYRRVAGQNVFSGMSQVRQLRAKLQEDAPPLKTGRTDALARGFEAVVSRALARDPADRYATAEEMIAALTDLRGMHAATGSRSSVTRRRVIPASPERRMRHSVLAAIGALALCACGALGAAHRASATATTVPAAQAAVAPQVESGLTGTPADSEGPTGQPVCPAGPSAIETVPAPAKDPEALSQRPPASVRAQRARDADLMRAIRSAVEEEAYMTLSIPDLDLMPIDRTTRGAATASAVAVARR
jgi:serine/threonine-protein kinase